MTEQTAIKSDYSVYYNYGYNGNELAGASHSGADPAKWRRTKQIKRPSALVMNADAASAASGKPSGYYTIMESWDSYFFLANPHSAPGHYYGTTRSDKRFFKGKSNILWADGHVGNMKKAEDTLQRPYVATPGPNSRNPYFWPSK